MAKTTVTSNSAYQTKEDDYKGACYRPNTITQSIHARLVDLEQPDVDPELSLNSGYAAYPVVANSVTPDLGLGFTCEVYIHQATVVNFNNPIYTGGVIKPGQDLWINVIQDANGRPSPTFSNGYTTPPSISLSANLMAVYWFKVRMDGKFQCIYQGNLFPR